MLTVHLVSEGPEDTLPNQSRLGVLESQQILIVWALRNDAEVEVGDVEPETDHGGSGDKRPALEPTLGVDVVQGPIRVSLHGSSDWETMRGVFLCHDTEGVHDIRYLLRHASQDGLFGVPESSIEDTLFKSKELVTVLACDKSII